MRKLMLVFLTFLGLVGALISCQGPQKSGVENASWPAKMQELSQAFNKILPYIYSPTNYSNPKNREIIDAGLKGMSKLAHQVDTQEMKMRPDYDPSLEYLTRELSEDIRGAEAAFAMGNTEYSRLVMGSVVSRCFYCHTRTDFGPQLHASHANLQALELRPSDRAELLVALRDYDAALEVLQKALSDAGYVGENFFETEKVIKKLLFIAIRVKRDPSLAQSAVDRLLANPALPHFLKKDALVWKKSLQSWIVSQKRAEKNPPSPAAEARRLLGLAQKIQEYPMDSAAEVEYLRASGYLHDQLKMKMSAKETAETLQLLGRCYEALRDVGFWNLHEIYFAQCIREVPHTELAEACYRSYEASVVLGYSGSGGIFLPENVLKELQGLHELAKSKGE